MKLMWQVSFELISTRTQEVKFLSQWMWVHWLNWSSKSRKSIR